MIMTTPPSRGIWSRKRKQEVEETSPSTKAVSEKNLETAPMVLAMWKTMAYKGISMVQGLVEVLVEMEASTTPGMEEDFKPHKANAKKMCAGGQMWRNLQEASELG